MNLGLKWVQFVGRLKYWRLIKGIGAAVFLLASNLLSCETRRFFQEYEIWFPFHYYIQSREGYSQFLSTIHFCQILDNFQLDLFRKYEIWFPFHRYIQSQGILSISSDDSLHIYNANRYIGNILD